MTDVRRALPRPSLPTQRPSQPAPAPRATAPASKVQTTDESTFDVTTSRTSNRSGASASAELEATRNRTAERTFGTADAPTEARSLGRTRELGSTSFDLHSDAFRAGVQSADGRSGAAIEVLEAQVSGGASLNAGLRGVQARANVEAHVNVVDAEAHGAIGGEHANLAGSVHGQVTADAHANGTVQLDRHGLHASADAGAFAGARAEARVSGSVAGVGGHAGIEAQAGIGATAHAELQAGDGHIRAKLQLGACLGLGLKVSVGVDINYRQMARTAGAAATAVGHAATRAGTAVVNAAAQAGTAVVNAAANTMHAAANLASNAASSVRNAASNFAHAVGGLTHMFGW